MMYPPNPAIKCALCLYGLMFGYGRIATQLFGSQKRRLKVAVWIKWHKKKTPHDRMAAWDRIRKHRKSLLPPKPKPIKPVKIRFYCKTEKKLRCYLRSKIWKAFKHNLHVPSAEALLGCSIGFFRTYIKAMMVSKMNMANYGTYWHLDHITPCHKFYLLDPAQKASCFHYKNYQPLRSSHNKHKAGRSDRYAAQLPLIL